MSPEEDCNTKSPTLSAPSFVFLSLRRDYAATPVAGRPIRCRAGRGFRWTEGYHLSYLFGQELEFLGKSGLLGKAQLRRLDSAPRPHRAATKLLAEVCPVHLHRPSGKQEVLKQRPIILLNIPAFF